MDLGSTVHGVCECKEADMNKAACRVYATSMSFWAFSQAGEEARRRHVGHILPLCCFQGLLVRERG